MSIKEFSVSKALLDHLKTISGLPPIAAENASFTPTINVPYMREQDYGGTNQAPTLAADGFQRLDGIYRIGVFVPKATGKFNALGYIDTVVAGFPRGLVLTHAGQKVRIERHQRETAFIDGEWYQCGVQIFYTVVN